MSKCEECEWERKSKYVLIPVEYCPKLSVTFNETVAAFIPKVMFIW